MPPHNNIQGSQSSRTPAATTPRPGHRIREIRQEIHQRHHQDPSRYRLTPPGPFAATGRPPMLSVTSDEYQLLLYLKSRGTNPRERLRAAREAVATSPHTWEDLTADGVRERVEESLEDDVLLARAVESLGELEVEDRPYFGKFTAERIDEILTDAEAGYWYRYWHRGHR
ncbi:hypothetical protein [Arthrobacter bambusae]|uniref:hypothetical protein n=1 Tax=Arthrobacter bambusae TaxID=1338426 RepID=UPI00277FFE15|nr:hypothetical protein [Arthrobacter bambusae]MDQ0212127.1 hypothetical protein [Arthrobacter bambusae]MDQ0236655.1 hypothetical protein [Arthrobacter bambusae]